MVVWDAPGCGRSSDPPEPETFRLSDFADYLAGFVDANRNEGVGVVEKR